MTKVIDSVGTLWAIRDKGTEPEVLFKTPAPLAQLALYDVTVGHQGDRASQRWDKAGSKFYTSRQQPRAASLKKPEAMKKKNAATTSSAPAAATLWAATTGAEITGYDSTNGALTHLIDVRKLLNVTNPSTTTCRVTSKVMVARSQDGTQERLVFAMSEDGNGSFPARQGGGGGGRVVSNTSTPFVVAVSVDRSSREAKVLWKVVGKRGSEIVGQIVNMLVVPPGPGRRSKRQKGERESLKEEGDWGRGGGDGDGDGDDGDDDDDDDDAEVLLVATAVVSGGSQYSFAVGHL
ncbi:uncharacterized protein LOC143293999 [Babylonia areolata]|uniref:uncharacterized protein LOC143293999 n=1 Tax=Babylonia areolata TaxID=304850 RepID=UPI003FD33CFD